MSSRTLPRRLADHGATYQNLVDEARFELAEIPFLTGFSAQSAFTRAFKCWAGKTPGAFRSQPRA
jgi:AraC-like DNA-binding protein